MTKPINILLADDHRILRTGLKLLLSSQGDFHVAAEASNGREVLDILKTTPVDVVLLDLSMPVMSGLDCLKEIKRRGLAVKILVLTMYSEQQYIKEVMTQGADGYICKDAIPLEQPHRPAEGPRRPVGPRAGSPDLPRPRLFPGSHRRYAPHFHQDRIDVQVAAHAEIGLHDEIRARRLRLSP